MRAFCSFDREDEALKTLRRTVAQIPTRELFERWLLGFPAETRLQVRMMVQSVAPWTIENRRTRRQALEQRASRVHQRALECAGVLV